MSQNRNEKAVCGNCPYFLQDNDTYMGLVGYCRQNSRVALSPNGPLDTTFWCGDHPNFFSTAPEAPQPLKLSGKTMVIPMTDDSPFNCDAE